MAKKKQTFNIDDFNLDSELNVDDFNLEDIDGLADHNIDKNNRNPVARAFTGVVGGIASTVKNPTFQEKIIKRSLPEQYGDSIDLAKEVTENVGNLYNEVVKEVKPTVNKTIKQIDQLIPAQYTRIKKILGKAADKTTPDEPYRSSYNQERLREEGLQASLKELFDQQIDGQAQLAAKDKAEDLIKNQIETKRFKSDHSLLLSINNSLSRLASFGDSITNAFYKKSIEIQYRSYFVQSDTLNAIRESSEISKKQQDAIVKNTALPEYVKLKQSERFKEVARTKFFETAQNKLFSGSKEALKKGFGRLNNSVKSDLSNLTFAVEGGLMGVEQYQENKKMMADLGIKDDNVDKAGNLGGGFLSEIFLDKVAGKIRNKLVDKNGKVNKLGHFLQTYSRNVPGAVSDLRKSDKLREKYAWEDDYNGFKDGPKNILKSTAKKLLGFFEEGSQDRILDSGGGVMGLSQPGVGYDNASRKSLITVIPGYLAKILKEIQIFRTGNAGIEETLFDFSKDKFLSKKESVKATKSFLQERMNTGGFTRNLESLTDHIQGENKLSPKAQKALHSRLGNLISKNKLFTSKDLLDPEFTKSLDPDIKDEIEKALQIRFPQDDENINKTDNELSEKTYNLKQSLKDVRGDIQALLNAGQIDQLLELGVVKRTKNYSGETRYEIDFDKYYALAVENTRIKVKKTDKKSGDSTSTGSGGSGGAGGSGSGSDSPPPTINDAVKDIKKRINTKFGYAPDQSLKTTAIATLGSYSFMSNAAKAAITGVKEKVGYDREKSLFDNIKSVAAKYGISQENANVQIAKAKEQLGYKPEMSVSDIAKDFAAKRNITLEEADKQINKFIEDYIPKSLKNAANGKLGSGGLAGASAGIVGNLLGNIGVKSPSGEHSETPSPLTADSTPRYTSGGNVIDSVISAGTTGIKKLTGFFRDEGAPIAPPTTPTITPANNGLPPLTHTTPPTTNTPTQTPTTGQIDTEENKSENVLKQLAKLITGGKTAYNDTNADGRREGDQFERLEQQNKAAEEKRKNRKTLQADNTPRYKTAQNVIDTIIDSGKKMFELFTDNVGKLSDAVGGAADAASAAGDVAESVGDMIDGPEGPDGKQTGRRKPTWRERAKNRWKNRPKSYREMIGRIGENRRTGRFGAGERRLFGGVRRAAGKGIRKVGRGVRSLPGKYTGMLGAIRESKRTGLLSQKLPWWQVAKKGAGLARTAAWSTALFAGDVLGAIGGGALASAGSVLGSIGAALISTPVLIGAAGLAVVGGAYYLYKRSHRNDATKLEQLRLAQYGFADGEKDSFHNVYNLENYLEDNLIIYRNRLPVISEKLMTDERTKEILDLFDVSPDNEDHLNRFVTWFENRFKPLFLSHLAAKLKVTDKLKLKDINELNEDLKRKYIQLSEFTDGPYDAIVSPLAGKEKLSATVDLINKLRQEALADLKDDKNFDTKYAIHDVAKKAITSGLNDVELDKFIKEGLGANKNKADLTLGSALAIIKAKMAATGDPKLANATISAKATAQISRSLGEDVTALEAVRFKAYGIRVMERLRVSTLRSLEDLIYDGVTIGTEGKVEFNKDIVKVLNSISSEFAIKTIDSKEAIEWTTWFKTRFLPVYLSYVGQGYQLTKKLKSDEIEMNLKESAKYEIAKKISSIPNTWTVTNSPWADIKMNTDPDSILANLASLEKKAEKDVLNEEKAKTKEQEAAEKAASAKKEADAINKLKSAASSAPKPPTGNIINATASQTGNLINTGDTSSPNSSDTPTRDHDAAANEARINSRLNRSAMGGGNTLATMNNGGFSVPAVGTISDKSTSSQKDMKGLIAEAAKKAGVDPLMMQTFAAVESDFNPNAGAKTSSAKGMYQFLTSTWNEQINSKTTKKYNIDPNTSVFDPTASTILAAEYIKKNLKLLKKVKPNPTIADVYLTHFLGSGGGPQFLSLAPDDIPAKIMPKQTRANANYFYENGKASGKPVTAAVAYQRITDRVTSRAAKYGIPITGNTPFEGGGSNNSSSNTNHDSEAGSSSGAITSPGANPGTIAAGATTRKHGYVGDPADYIQTNNTTPANNQMGSISDTVNINPPAGGQAYAGVNINPAAGGQSSISGTTTNNYPSTNNATSAPGAAPTTDTTSPPGVNLADASKGDKFIKLKDPGINIKDINQGVMRNFKAMAAEYGEKTNKSILVGSGYRTYAQQDHLYRTKPKGKAARPGRSMHEFGMALDISSRIANELNSLGLLRKYGFVRPVKGEAWHIEPNGIQGSYDAIRTNGNTQDSFKTKMAMAAVGRANVRDEGSSPAFERQAADEGSPPIPQTNPAQTIPVTGTAPNAQASITATQTTPVPAAGLGYNGAPLGTQAINQTAPGAAATPSINPALVPNINPPAMGALGLETSITKFDETMNKSVTVQTQMLEALRLIVTNTDPKNAAQLGASLESMIKQVNSKTEAKTETKTASAFTNQDIPTKLPKPGVSLSRKLTA